MQSIQDKMASLIAIKQYNAAYLLGANILEQHPNDEEALNALCFLTDHLRSQCIDLEFKKRETGTQYAQLESLLIKTSKLTNQDRQGAFK